MSAREPKRCPRCAGWIPTNENPGAHPGALSRVDNETEICSKCGIAEALLAAMRGELTDECVEESDDVDAITRLNRERGVCLDCGEARAPDSDYCGFSRCIYDEEEIGKLEREVRHLRVLRDGLRTKLREFCERDGDCIDCGYELEVVLNPDDGKVGEYFCSHGCSDYYNHDFEPDENGICTAGPQCMHNWECRFD